MRKPCTEKNGDRHKEQGIFSYGRGIQTAPYGDTWVTFNKLVGAAVRGLVKDWASSRHLDELLSGGF